MLFIEEDVSVRKIYFSPHLNRFVLPIKGILINHGELDIENRWFICLIKQNLCQWSCIYHKTSLSIKK